MSRTLLALALLRPAVAHAEEEPVAGDRYQLRWEREGGAESCVSGAVLSRLLEQVLGAHSSPGASGPILLEGVARPATAPLRFSVRVTVRDARSNELFGERELTTSDAECSALTPALLLVLAMSVDPDAGRAGLPAAVEQELQHVNRETTRDAPAPSAPAPQVPLAATPAPAVAEPARPAPAAQAGSEANEARIFGTFAVASEIMPSLTLGAGFGARLPLRRQWSLSFSLFGWKPESVSLPNSAFLQDDGVQVAAGQVAMALCRPLLGERLQLDACAGFGAGLRWVWARALANENNPTRAFFGPELGLEGSWSFGSSWFLATGATTQVQLRRDRFSYRDHRDQAQTWFEPAPLVSRFWLSLGATL